LSAKSHYTSTEPFVYQAVKRLCKRRNIRIGTSSVFELWCSFDDCGRKCISGNKKNWIYESIRNTIPDHFFAFSERSGILLQTVVSPTVLKDSSPSASSISQQTTLLGLMMVPTENPDLSHESTIVISSTKLFIMHFSPPFCYFLSVTLKYSPRHPVLRHFNLRTSLSPSYPAI
jgi:hypothetical protein